MNDEITNKVAASNLEVFDLEDYYPSGTYTQIDVVQWLFEGVIVKEKDFREQLKKHDWSQYKGHYVTIACSKEVILPSWVFILVTVQLVPFAKKIVNGTLENIKECLYEEILSKIDYSKYQDKPVILKGCSKKQVPMRAYILAIQYLLPFAKSIMYGEACSAVPLYKR